MTGLAVVVFLVLAIALLTVPREYAPIPLLLGCCYIPMGQGVELGPISLHFYRLMLLAGFVRIMSRGEVLDSELSRIDKLLILLCLWNVFASLFHEKTPGSGPVYALGTLFNLLLTYFLIRIWCRDTSELVGLIALVGFLLFPVSLEMISEKMTGKNLFSELGGVSSNVTVRDGELRAQGPFRHSILAGTVGAAVFPLMMGIWTQHRIASIIGMISCVTIVLCSASSGPILSAIAGVGMVMLWRFRHHSYRFFYLLIAAYIVLDFLTTRPAYYLVTNLNVTGSSTAYYRARIIDTTVKHFSEWWMFGTDRTVHWIPQGIGSVIGGKHMDITNYYIAWGVNAGLIAIIILVTIFITGLKTSADFASEPLEDEEEDEVELDDDALDKIEERGQAQFLVWCLGAGLLAHMASGLSISYFDQSQIFLWFNVALVASSSCFLDFDEDEDEELTEVG